MVTSVVYSLTFTDIVSDPNSSFFWRKHGFKVTFRHLLGQLNEWSDVCKVRVCHVEVFMGVKNSVEMM